MDCGLTEHPLVDILGPRYKPVNFGAGKSCGQGGAAGVGHASDIGEGHARQAAGPWARWGHYYGRKARHGTARPIFNLLALENVDFWGNVMYC